MFHRHWLITEHGADLLEYDDAEITVAYASYVKLRRSDELPPPRIDGLQVEYGGFAIIDRADCPGCFD